MLSADRGVPDTGLDVALTGPASWSWGGARARQTVSIDVCKPGTVVGEARLSAGIRCGEAKSDGARSG